MLWRREWKKIEGRAASPQPSLDPLRPLGSSPLKRGQLGGTGIAKLQVLPHREDLGGSLTKLMQLRPPLHQMALRCYLPHQVLGIRADEGGGGDISILLGGRKIGEKLVV